MIDHATYLAACERLRRLASGEDFDEVYCGEHCGCDSHDIDKATVYDAEHDETPATVEWLRETGFFQYPDEGRLFNGVLSVDYVTRNKRLPIYFDNRYLLDNPTRGDVLTLLRVFNERKV